jgi:adenylate cyclase
MTALAPAELSVTGPDGITTKYKLGEKTIIGRHPDCEVILTDPMSSRRHCKIERGGTLFFVEDNGSANGTLLNNEPLKTRMAFRNGDTMQIGSTLMVLRLDVAVSRAPSQRVASYEPGMSIVRLDEESANAFVDFTQTADAQVVSEEEAASSDVGKLKRVTERLKLLVDVGQAMGTSLDPHKLLDICLEKLFEVFPQADRGLIVLYGPDGSLPATLTPEKEQSATLDRRKGAITKVRFRAASSTDNEIKLSRTVVNKVKTDRQSVLVTDATGDAAGMSMARFEIMSLMCSPLLIGQDNLGLIQLETKSRQQAFNRDDLSVMTAVAGQVAVVIRNSELALNAAAAAAQRENLSRFLSPNLVDEVLKGSLSVALGGTEKKGTIFFSDIVSFTKLAAKMSAHDVVTLLNRYFTVMQNIIFRRGGSIDKCAGDNIMAHWGVLGDMPDFTASGVAASVEMQIALFAFNRDEALKQEIKLPPVPLGHGIGLNTGIVCAGNIGSDRKVEFTVIGDAVNLSARIEAMAGRGQTFLGEPTWLEIKDRAFCVRMPDCPAKNVAKPLPVYSVRGIVPPPLAGAKAVETADDPAIPAVNKLLFCMPCTLAGADGAEGVPAMVTRITRSPGGDYRFAMQVEKDVAVGAKLKLAWNLPEIPSLPEIEGDVEKSAPITVKHASGSDSNLAGATPEAVNAAIAPKTGTAILSAPVAPGTVVLKVREVPAAIADWAPGTLLQTDLKSHEEIVRA